MLSVPPSIVAPLKVSVVPLPTRIVPPVVVSAKLVPFNVTVSSVSVTPESTVITPLETVAFLIVLSAPTVTAVTLSVPPESVTPSSVTVSSVSVFPEPTVMSPATVALSIVLSALTVTAVASSVPPDSVTPSYVMVFSVSVFPESTVMSPVTVAFSISLEALTESVPVSSMVPPLIVAPLSVTVWSIVSVSALVKLPANVTPSSVTLEKVNVPLVTVRSPPPLTVAFSISLEALTESVPGSSIVPPEIVAPLSVTVSSIVSLSELAKLPASVTLSSVTSESVSVPPATVRSPPPLTVAFSISLEALTESVPVSSMVPPLRVAPLSVTVPSIVSLSELVKLPARVTLSSVTFESVSVPPVTVRSPPPLTVAFSISLEAATDSVPASSIVPPLMVAPLSVTVSSIVSLSAFVKLPARVTLSSVTSESVSVPPVTVRSPPPLTVAFSISLEALTDSVPASSITPPLMVVPPSSVASGAPAGNEAVPLSISSVLPLSTIRLPSVMVVPSSSVSTVPVVVVVPTSIVLAATKSVALAPVTLTPSSVAPLVVMSRALPAEIVRSPSLMAVPSSSKRVAAPKVPISIVLGVEPLVPVTVTPSSVASGVPAGNDAAPFSTSSTLRLPSVTSPLVMVAPSLSFSVAPSSIWIVPGVVTDDSSTVVVTKLAIPTWTSSVPLTTSMVPEFVMLL